MHVLNTKPKENSLVYVYFLFWITFKFILLPSAVSFRYYPINDYDSNEIFDSVSNSGAKAPEWRFWTSQWRLKFSGAGRFLATLKNNLRIIMIMKLFLQL